MPIFCAAAGIETIGFVAYAERRGVPSCCTAKCLDLFLMFGKQRNDPASCACQLDLRYPLLRLRRSLAKLPNRPWREPGQAVRNKHPGWP